MTTPKPVEPVINPENFQSNLTGHVFGIVDSPRLIDASAAVAQRNPTMPTHPGERS